MRSVRSAFGRGWIVLVLAFATFGVALAQDAGQPAAPPPPPPPPPQEAPAASNYTMQADVNLVVLHVSVVDANGQFLPGLATQDFRVYEDGVPQKIAVMKQEDAPVSMGLLIDNSDSMEEKRAQVNAAALALVEASNRDDEVYVAHFSDGYELDTDFTPDLGILRTALNHTESRGATALYDAVANSLDHLKAGFRDKKVLLIVSDGEDNESKYSLAEALEQAQRSNALIYAIGLLREEQPESAARDRHALLALTQATGGSAYFPENIQDAQSICTQIARDIRHQYTIGYYPTNAAKDGTFRTLRVELTPGASAEKLTVRTRTGYFAGRAISQQR